MEDFAELELSVAISAPLEARLRAHLDKGPCQEDLTFAYWRLSVGAQRITAVISEIVLPGDGDRVLQGNVAFQRRYLTRVLAGRPQGAGIALLHCHPSPGWQGMSDDDVVAERDRLAGPVWGQSDLPILGLTSGTDGAWSARFWLRTAPGKFARRDVATVRVVGRALAITHHPDTILPEPTASQAATVSVWGEDAQLDLVRARIGIGGVYRLGRR